MRPVTVNRMCGVLAAALERTAKHHKPPIGNGACRVGLSGLPDAEVARNVVLDTPTVHAFRRAAYARDRQLGC